MTAARVAALVPAYDAAATVGAVVRDTLGSCRPCSSPTTAPRWTSAARAPRARDDPADTNGGKGAALVRGFRALVEHGFTHAVTVDADGQHLASEIPALLAASAAAPDAIVVGVRQKEGHEIHAAARAGNCIADALMHVVAGQALPDTQSGFRVYPLPATLALGAVGARYDFETEVLLRAARHGLALVGVPVRVHYPPIAERVSHFEPWTDTLRIIGTVVRVLVGG